VRTDLAAGIVSFLFTDIEGGREAAWYRIPDSRQWSSGLRLSTDGPVSSGGIQRAPARYRVRLRVQAGADHGRGGELEPTPVTVAEKVVVDLAILPE